jgi:hypothetical protein
MPERWLHELKKLGLLEPPDGLWERAAILAKDRADLRPRSSIGGTGLRKVRSAAAAALAIGLVAAVIILVRSPGSGQPFSGPGKVFTDPRFGWTVRSPKGLLVRHISGQYRWSLNGVRVSNFAPDLGHPTGSEPESGWLRSFPATGVAAQIWYLGGPAPATPPRSSRFPLRASSFSRIRPYAGGSEPAPLYRTFTADGYSFNVSVWFGRDASAAARHAIWSVIRSLRFPRLHEGTIWNGSVYVLGLARAYPVGSVTEFPAASLPIGRLPRYTRGFYLIRSPRGLYVIDRFFVSPNQGMVRCSLAFERASSRFSCPGTKLSWNLAGRELDPHPGPVFGWDLTRYAAAVATDGHVLVSKLFGRP